MPAKAEVPTPEQRAALEALVAAYPDHLAAIEAGDLVWHDGTRMPVGDGDPSKPLVRRLASPDILDMLVQEYPAGAPLEPPATDFDPGRARNAALFDKMYGDCTRKKFVPRLVEVVWLPRKWGGRVKVTPVNGVDRALAAVSDELDALPPEYDRYLSPPAGAYNCRPIAAEARGSPHGWGIAIDLAVVHANYWLWARRPADRPVWRNKIPRAIVDIFERHGFIWGGRWHHYDTMHFEYRPELLPDRVEATARGRRTR